MIYEKLMDSLHSLIDLQVLQQTLPSQVFTLLIQKMREYGNKAAAEEIPDKAAFSEDINDDLE